jgi:thioredoxin 1
MSHIDLTSESFKKEVLDEKEKIVIVDFWADWCMPCHMLSPVIEELGDEYSDKVKVAKIDVDENSDIASEYQVMSIPNVIFFKDGVEVTRLIGVRPKEDFKKELDKLI